MLSHSQGYYRNKLMNYDTLQKMSNNGQTEDFN